MIHMPRICVAESVPSCSTRTPLPRVCVCVRWRGPGWGSTGRRSTWSRTCTCTPSRRPARCRCCRGWCSATACGSPRWVEPAPAPRRRQDRLPRAPAHLGASRPPARHLALLAGARLRQVEVQEEGQLVLDGEAHGSSAHSSALSPCCRTFTFLFHVLEICIRD